MTEIHSVIEPYRGKGGRLNSIRQLDRQSDSKQDRLPIKVGKEKEMK